MTPKTEPDFDAVYLGEGIEQDALDRLYQQYVEQGKPFVARANGAPVFVVRLTVDQSRKLIKESSGVRYELKMLPGSEYLQHLQITRCIDGWIHWIAMDHGMEQLLLKQWLKEQRKP